MKISARDLGLLCALCFSMACDAASSSTDELPAFVVAAKRETYAAQGDRASVPPLLAGSRQLEYRQGSWSYRDIYFGFRQFTGQEVVSQGEQVVWSMGYSGGVTDPDAPAEDVAAIYSFLRAALRLADSSHPFRGPARFTSGNYTYECTCDGNLERFHGEEAIRCKGRIVYSLVCAGGLVR